MKEQDIINRRFIKVYETFESYDVAKRKLEQYPYSGLSLINKIKPYERIIDIGCGHNIFKEYFSNLIGIDPVGPGADFCVTLNEFKSDMLFDVALCLGSIQYGTKHDVYDQLEKTINLLSPTSRIYFRFNVDTDKPKEYRKYIWTEELIREAAAYFNFVVVEIQPENYGSRKKLYSEWVRSKILT